MWLSVAQTLRETVIISLSWLLSSNLPLGRHNPLTQASNLSQNITDILSRYQHWFYYLEEGAPTRRRKIQENSTCQTLPGTEQFLTVSSWSKSRFSCSQKLQSGTFLQIIHDCLKTIVDSKNMLLCGHSPRDEIWRKTLLWANLFSPSTLQKILFMAKNGIPRNGLNGKKITTNYRDQDFLFHFSEIHIILPFSAVTLLNQRRPSHMIQGWRWRGKNKSLQKWEY